MKISIDTKGDTREEIRKAVEMLSSFLEESEDAGPAHEAGPYAGTAAKISHSSGAGSTVDVRDILIENKEEEIKIPEPKIVDNVEKKDEAYRIISY